MATATKPSSSSPLIRGLTFERKTDWGQIIRLIPAVFVSVVFHAGLFAIFFLLAAPSEAVETELMPTENVANVQPEPPPEPISNDPLTITDIDPNAIEPDLDINYDLDREADISVPGLVDPNNPVGIENADIKSPPMNIPAPPGFDQIGQGGAQMLENVMGNSDAVGQVGGMIPNGVPIAGSFYGRGGATRQKALREGGGTKETEAAVARGLNWLIRMQQPDGAWRMEGPYPDKGKSNDIAGTAFGLLPFLGAGKTHKAAKDNPFDKPIERALRFLLTRQDKRTGNFGGGMYAHCLATIAMCEAYGLTQDPILRRPAQGAVNYLITAQHAAGGWRYSPGQAGDTSVTGWAVMAIKSAKMSGLDVPEMSFKKAVRYLDSCRSESDGYGYVGSNATYTMTAVGLLCRQYLQAWGPQTPKMIRGIENHLKPNPPGKFRNMYYYYYATQVMHHFGGDEWKSWNERMRADLVKRQQKSNNPLVDGSWSPKGDRHADVGGRLMETSLCLLTLEVYYRYLPLYYREAGERQQQLLMGS